MLLLSFRKKRKEYTVTFFFSNEKHCGFKYKRKKCKYTSRHTVQHIFLTYTSGCKKKMISHFTGVYQHIPIHNPSFRLYKLNRLSFAVEFPNSHPKHTVCRDQQKDLTFFCVLHILTLLYSWEEKKNLWCCLLLLMLSNRGNSSWFWNLLWTLWTKAVYCFFGWRKRAFLWTIPQTCEI